MRISSRYLGSCWMCRSCAVIRSSACIRRRALRVRLVKPCTPRGRILSRSCTNRVTVRTVSHSRVASVGKWILVSTGGVDAQPLAIFQTELDGGLHHRLIDRLHSDWGEPIKRTIESIVFGYAVAMEVRKGAQGITVVDAFAQLAIIPVFDAHEGQRAQGLRRGNPVAASVGVLQPAYQILAHLLDQRGMVIQESENALQPRVEVNALIP